VQRAAGVQQSVKKKTRKCVIFYYAFDVFPVNISNIVYQKSVYEYKDIQRRTQFCIIKRLLVTHSIIVVFILLVYNYYF